MSNAPLRAEPQLGTSAPGYSYPLSRDGRLSLLTPPPWHFAGSVLMVDYWGNPEDLRQLLPEGLEPDPDGRCAAVFAQWQWCSAERHELATPLRNQFAEFLVLIGATLSGRPVARVPFAWVDDVVSMTRGWVQGMPKQLGRIRMTQDCTVGGITPAGDGTGTYHGEAALDGGGLIASARVDLEVPASPVEPPWLHTLPLVHTRHAAAWVGDEAADRLVSSEVSDVAFSPVHSGTAELSLVPAAYPGLALVQPVRVGAGYRFDYAETLLRGVPCADH